MAVTIFFLISGGILLLGFAARFLFEKTRIPDVLLLMGMGVFLGKYISPEVRQMIYSFAPYLGTLALIMILFEGGLHIDPRRALTQTLPALQLSSGTFALSALIVIAACHLFMGWGLAVSLLFGVILGCTSSAIVIPVAERIPMSRDTRTLIGLEAAFSDTFAIVSLVALLEIIKTQGNWLLSGLTHLGISFGIAAFSAFVISLAWLLVLEYTKDRPLSYLITFAVLILLYGMVEFFHGSGAVAVLLFGILITEGKHIPRWLFVFGRPVAGSSRQEAHETLQWFHQELTFLIRTGFFVYLGLLFERDRISAPVFIAASVFSALIVMGRLCSVYLFRRQLAAHDRSMLAIFMPRGLVTAVLATIPASQGIAAAGQFLDYVIPVVLLTNVLMAAGALFIRGSVRQPELVEA